MGDATREIAGAETVALAESTPHGIAFFKPRATQFLEQGDLIPREAVVINETLRRYHGYHVEKPVNEMFAVLTQSCDLVRRPRCKARYITLAPVRPMRVVLLKEFGTFFHSTPGDQYTIGSEETRGRYEDFVERLVNNNDSRYFYLPAKPEVHVAEPMCIMLPLPMSIRVEHYDACLAGRIAQLDDLFQAKLGWLLGQQFSRVGTPDWPEPTVRQTIDDVTQGNMTWYPDDQCEQVIKAIEAFAREKPGQPLEEADLLKINAATRSRVDQVIDAVLDVLEKLGKVPPGRNGEKFAVRKELQQRIDFKRHIRS